MHKSDETVALIRDEDSVTYGSRSPSESSQFSQNLVFSLDRSLSFCHGFAFVVGIMLGAGLFVSPGLVVKRTPNIFVALSMWTICGIICMLAASVYCELNGMFPKTGSTYIYVLQTFGRVPGFMVVWSYVVILTPAAISVVLLTFGAYITQLFIEDQTTMTFVITSKAIGFAAFLFMVGLNSIGVQVTGHFQYLFSLSQTIIVLLLAGLGIYEVCNSADNLTNFNFSVAFNNTLDVFKFKNAGTFGLAVFNTMWAYDGWSYVPFLSEELINPDRNMPLITFTAIPFVVFLYLLLNVLFMLALTKEELTRSVTVAVTLAHKVAGKKFSYIMPVFIAITCLGTLNSDVYSASRFFMSAAREKQLPSVLGFIHRKRRTPLPAIFLTCILTAIWTCIGRDVEDLIFYFNSCIWLIFGAGFASCLYLKLTRAEYFRPYKVYLANPVCMVCVSVILVFLAVVAHPTETAFCMLVVALSLPVYFIFFHKKWGSRCVSTTFSDYLTKKLNLVPCDI